MTDYDLLDERQKTHGDYIYVAAVSQRLKEVLQDFSYGDAPPPVRESLDMICSKIARIVAGDWTYDDHWVDIAGYAGLIVKWFEVVPNPAGEPEAAYAHKSDALPRSPPASPENDLPPAA